MRSWRSRTAKIGRYLLALLLLGLAWKALAEVLGSSVLPPPEAALAAFGRDALSAAFWRHFGASAFRAVSAMLLAWLIAFPLGILMGGSRRIDALLSPFVSLTYPIPKIVLLPIFLLLLGLGDASKIAMIALILAYQILVTTRDGVRGVHHKHIDSVTSLGAGRLRVFLDVLLPAALPHGFTALRLGTGVSVAVLFFVESFATQTGLGYMIIDAWGSLDYLRMFSGIFGMSLLGVLLYEGTDLLERLVCAWRYQGRR
ncbi:ABC-type nitrate/sulfonate/bicarbonate transport system, permease component [Desulfocurvibacter africanus PCS]|uniref:ABC-type nitrate/sulfonate/bicarbonate transport system, permease component n=1 Tax=Desulfocurvibacter africanus PCS TaxID=1262666 RepID=M5PP88_DESAF|nr:ABC transporter permease [Desulfocurvibacter africanus]EMG36052.1 ABC-type nitrate/sulfonate/bicarbonate transport system, permease component [Desulfocurvibacter africanus PCS]